MVRFAVQLALGLALLAVGWVVSSSLIFLWLEGLLGDPRIAWWQRPIAWLLYAQLAGHDWLQAVHLVVAALPLPAIGLGLLLRYRRTFGPTLRPPLFAARAPAVLRGVTDNHGHADWLPMAGARALFPGPHPAYGGVVVGEAYRVDQDARARDHVARDSVARDRFDPADRRTWGSGGAAPLLIDPCTSGPTHSLVFAGSGGFKTTSAVSTILHWTGSLFVLDPSCELGPMLAEARRDIGHTVHQIALDEPDSGFDVLDWIDIASPLAETHIRSVVWWIAGGEAAGARKDDNATFFKARGHALIACLLAHLLWDERIPSTMKTLRTLRTGLVTPEKEMRDVLRTIHHNSRSAMARDYAGSLMELVDETFSGIYANADEDTAWLSNSAFAALVSGNGTRAFRTRDVLAGKTTIFLQLPLMALMHSPSVARVIIGALLNSVYEAEGRMQGRMLFLLDEAARLGTMRMLEDARDLGRKYGITLQLLYQSEGQLEKQWGKDGRRAWFDGVSWRAYAAIQDPETAKELCAVFGDYAVLAVSEGSNSGSSGTGLALASRSRGANRSTHEIKRALIRPDELLADVRADELFVIARGARPIRCGRAIYFRRRELDMRVHDNRFVRGAA